MNILFITQVYPDEKGTKTIRGSSVCHYWTKEWVKMGHQVYVIYLYPQYLSVLHKIAEFCPNYIAQFTNGTLTKKLNHSIFYELDGVHIYKIPMYKPIPKIRYGKDVINGIVDEIKDHLLKCRIKPDIILSHFDNPVLEIASLCKSFLHIPFAFVLHGYPSDIRRLYPHNYEELINNVDLWGFRSVAIKKDFESQYGTLSKSFIAYSGIPEYYIPKGDFVLEKEKGKVCYVGALIKRKYPEKVLEAMIPFMQKGEMSLTYIGEGALEKRIRNQAQKNKIGSRLYLLGQVDREHVQHELASTDIFVMVSRHETFGMVYLEAMAHGCITIASKNEGFDGIIVDGVNGFLCEAGNSNELRRIIEFINEMDADKKQSIRQAAISTAQAMTEHKMAVAYINDVCNLIK